MSTLKDRIRAMVREAVEEAVEETLRESMVDIEKIVGNISGPYTQLLQAQQVIRTMMAEGIPTTKQRVIDELRTLMDFPDDKVGKRNASRLVTELCQRGVLMLVSVQPGDAIRS